MKNAGALLAGLLSVILFFAAITLISLEGYEVVVLQTTTPAGGIRETRTWIADHEGFAFVEAANPERPFYRDILQRPEIELQRGGEIHRYRAVPLPQPEGHRLIRRLLSERYGIADWWIGILADTSQSVALRLEPLDRAPSPHPAR